MKSSNFPMKNCDIDVNILETWECWSKSSEYYLVALVWFIWKTSLKMRNLDILPVQPLKTAKLFKKAINLQYFEISLCARVLKRLRSERQKSFLWQTALTKANICINCLSNVIYEMHFQNAHYAEEKQFKNFPQSVSQI